MIVEKYDQEIKSVVVFGGSGFIGTHVVENLLARGLKVTVFLRDSGRINMLPSAMSTYNPAQFFIGDMKDREAVLKAVSLHDGAINLAGILGTSETVNNPYPSVMVNILGALNFYEAVREHKCRAVQITVGNHFMNNSYAITKTTAERFALMYNKEHGTKIAVVRALNAYGPKQKIKPVRKIIPNFVMPALAKQPLMVYGDGGQVMDMIYVKDVAEILVRALLNKHDNYESIFEAGTGRETTVKEIAEMVNEKTNNPAGIDFQPMRQGEPPGSYVVGNPKTLAPLGEDLKLTKLEDGLDETIPFYQSVYEIHDM